jgi:iron complex outermembrane receptor protein
MKKQDILFRLISCVCFLSAIHLSNAQMGIVKGKVSSETEALPAATISVGSKTMLSDLKGNFSISIKPGKYILHISHVGYKKIEQPVTVNPGSEQSFEFVLQPDNQLSDVIVIGSRTQKQRSNLNSPVPIDVIQTSVIPGRQVAVAKLIENTIPSFSISPHGFREGKQTVPASLRGLGPERTLVLLNGRRLHTMAAPWTFSIISLGAVGTDLNAIPIASIETIEVLRDGASAQYGSDAIAGVINLQLKKSTGITSMQLQTGQYYKGDGESVSFSINRGFVIWKKGFLNFTAQSRFTNYTQRNGEYNGTVYYNIPGTATQAQKDSIIALDNQNIAARGFSRKNHRPLGDNRVMNTSFSINGGYSLNKNTSLDWTATWNYRVAKDISSNAYRYPKDSLTTINSQLYPDGFLPYMRPKTPDMNMAGGINGITTSGWHWDAGFIFGKNSTAMDVFNSNNASQYLQGSNAPTSFYTGKQIFTQLTHNINLSKEILKNTRNIKSFSIAMGEEFRMEHYSIKEGEEASWKNYSPTSGRFPGSQGQAGFQPENVVNKSRQVNGIYVEAELEKNEKLLVNIAGRYEYYSDFGDNLAGKIAFRYKFSKYFLWRSSVSNGFRAPALQQKYYSLITTQNTLAGGLVRTITFRNDSKIAEDFGILPLEAEKSFHFSSGITSAISKNISLTIDAYWIQIKNRIIYSSNISGSLPEVRSILNSNNLRDVQSVRFFSNAINTRTKGIDLVFAGRWSIKKSLVEISLAAHLSRTVLYGTIQYAKNLPDNESYRNLLVNREERNRVEDAYPRDKIIFNIIYSIGRWKLNTNFIRYGSVNQKANSTVNNPDETLAAKIIAAFNIAFMLKSNVTLTAGAENLFNTYPDRVKYPQNSQSGLIMYNPNFSPFGCNGGYYFLNMTIKF